MYSHSRIAGLASSLFLLLAACGGPVAPQWQRITPDSCGAAARSPDCSARVFHLDTANITEKGGVTYVVMRTTSFDAADAGYGLIRAEANCRGRKIEPSALKEDVYSADGKLVESARLAVISTPDAAAVLAAACK